MATTMRFRGKNYSLNPSTTDLHIGTIARALGERDSGYIPIDNWDNVAKQLCFIVIDCDFAKYDPVTKSGELYVTAEELIELLDILQNLVKRPQDDQREQIAAQIAQLQAQLEAVQ